MVTVEVVVYSHPCCVCVFYGSAATVSLLLETGDVLYDCGVTSAESIVSLVNDIGYECSLKEANTIQPPTNTMKVNTKPTYVLTIRGMTCASCVGSVERHLSSLPGVEHVTVNLITEEAVVRVNVSTSPDSSCPVTAESLVDAVSDLGYEASLKSSYGFDGDGTDGSNNNTPVSPTNSGDDLRASQLAQIRYYRNLLMFSSFFGIPVLIFAMVLSYVPAVKMALMKPIGNTQMEVFTLILWIPSTLVYVFIGRIFFKAAWSGLRHRIANMSLLVTLGTTAAYIVSLHYIPITIFAAAQKN